jgi:dTDP-4-dehydrorhamnose 3,5-epimerase
VVNYDISAFYEPSAARGARFDDPTFGIRWPLAPVVISARDLPPYAG